MQTKRLGNTDLHFTRIGLGTWAMGGGDWAFSWGAQDDQQSIQADSPSARLGGQLDRHGSRVRLGTL